MEKSIIFQIRSILRHGIIGMGKLIVPGLVLATISLVVLKSGTGRELALRIGITIPFIGFLWGLRVYEYSVRFSHWKDYLVRKATLAEAFAGIANRKIWIYMILAAYFCGIGFVVFFYLLSSLKQGLGGFHIMKFSFVNYILLIPICSVLFLFGANIFGPKPDDEEELALDVVGIMNKSPRISPMDIESQASIERFVNGATTGKGLDVKPYMWILSHIRSPQTMTAFRSALKNSDSTVRQLAVTYLCRIGGGDALHLLQEYCPEETDSEIKKLIEESTAQLSVRKNV